jgi:hypothetical protein
VLQNVNESVFFIAAFIVLLPHNLQKIDSVRLEMFDTLIFKIHALKIIYMLNILLFALSSGLFEKTLLNPSTCPLFHGLLGAVYKG